MTTLAIIVDCVWRAICDWATYSPRQMGSAWLTELSVEDGVVHFGKDAIPLADLDFVFAASVSPVVFP